jgi:hypothetical protein
MYQSSARKNFLDLLLEPTAIAILASLALHTIVGAGLPFFTKPEPEDKKAGPTTVKVVELTPNELQRIPQAAPVPTPQTVAPRPVAPSRPAPPRTSQFSTAPQTIPFSPLRPTDGTIFKPPVTKPKVVPQKKPVDPIFDPNAIFETPIKPQQPKIQKGVTPKPLPKVSPPVTTPPIARKPKKVVTPPNTETDDDGGDQPPTNASPATNPNRQAQQPPTGTTPGPATPTKPSNSQPTRPSGEETSGNGFYGRYTQAAIKRLIKYQQDIPGLVVYQKGVLKVDYPAKLACSKVKQSPYIVYMVAFDKVAEISPNDITGESLTQTVDKSTIFGDRGNEELFKYAAFKATEAATTADQSRLAADKGKRVLYQYRVEFDPASCKK